MRIQFPKTYLLSFLVGCLFCAQPVAAQSDSLLQQLISANTIDSSLIQPPSKMLFTQRALWGTNGILKNRYSGNDLVANRKTDLKIRRTMLQLHQIGGFVTIGGMLAQGIIGSQLYKGDYKVKDLHENVGMAVNLTYGFTALNGLFAPPSAFSRDKKNYFYTFAQMACSVAFIWYDCNQYTGYPNRKQRFFKTISPRSCVC